MPWNMACAVLASSWPRPNDVTAPQITSRAGSGFSKSIVASWGSPKGIRRRRPFPPLAWAARSFSRDFESGSWKQQNCDPPCARALQGLPLLVNAWHNAVRIRLPTDAVFEISLPENGFFSWQLSKVEKHNHPASSASHRCRPSAELVLFIAIANGDFGSRLTFAVLFDMLVVHNQLLSGISPHKSVPTKVAPRLSV